MATALLHGSYIDYWVSPGIAFSRPSCLRSFVVTLALAISVAPLQPSACLLTLRDTALSLSKMGFISQLVTLAIAATAAHGAAVPSCSIETPESYSAPAGDVSSSGKFVSRQKAPSSYGGPKKLSQQQTNGQQR